MKPVLSPAVCAFAILAAGSQLLTSVYAQDTKTLNINSFGGAYEEAHRKCVIEPFEKAHSAKINVTTAYSADAFAQLRAQKDAPQYDVIHFSGGQEIVGASEGLLLPLEAADLPNAGDLYDFAKAGLSKGEGPAYQLAVIGLLYNSEATPRPVEKWSDLSDPAFAENLVLTDISNGYGMLSFLMLNQVAGGSLENIQPGLDTVSSMLDAGAIVISKSPEIQQEFAQNDAWVAPYAQDYAYTLTSAGLPIVFTQGSEGSPAVFITANLVAGRENTDLAKKFIDAELSADAQACFAEAMRYSPTNSKTTISGAAADDVVIGASAVAGLLRFDPVVIETNRDAWVEAWKKTISR
jgi:putative spermidine/putrescine transport system substrate-binding protein